MTTRREAQLILPLSGNYGEDLDELHASLFADLTTKYGGVTVVHGVGGWRDPDDNIVQEPIAQYTVAYDPEAHPIGELIAIGCDYGTRAGQTAIYMRDDDGNIRFLEPNHQDFEEWREDTYANTIPA